MKRKAEEAEKTKFALIDAAMRVFLRRGYADATVEDICAEAAATRGAFYHYFESKAAIYYVLLEKRLELAQALIANILKSQLTPLAKIRQLLGSSLALLVTDKGYRDANELILLKTGFAEELGEGMEMKKKNMKAMVATLEHLLQQAVEKKEIRLKHDTHSSALHLYSTVTGTGSLWLLDRKYFKFPESPDNYVGMWIEGIMEK